jgi:hypothetical protein
MRKAAPFFLESVRRACAWAEAFIYTNKSKFPILVLLARSRVICGCTPFFEGILRQKLRVEL